MLKLFKSKRVMTVLAVVCVIVVVAGVWLWVASITAIPANIKKQLSFVVLYPQGNSDITVEPGTFKYDPQAKVLSFVVTSFGVKNTITEQATPDPFNDIPQYYDKVLLKLNSYSSFDTYIGKVNLAHPDSLNGDQAAVMNTKGVLMFAHPVKELTESQWRQFFNSLEVIK